VNRSRADYLFLFLWGLGFGWFGMWLGRLETNPVYSIACQSPHGVVGGTHPEGKLKYTIKDNILTISLPDGKKTLWHINGPLVCLINQSIANKEKEEWDI